MNGAFEILKRDLFSNTIYTLNWPALGPFRRIYLIQDFHEFFAEMQFILTVDPEGLKKHIATLDTILRMMYENVVRELEKYLKP